MSDKQARIVLDNLARLLEKKGIITKEEYDNIFPKQKG